MEVCFLETNLAPNNLNEIEKKQELRKHTISALINIALIIICFVWLPLTLAVIMLMPLFFVFPNFKKNKG